ncbi:uncharacterized protein LOC105276450 isoform X2 [Ooceraea biroi]|uniref:uncharacterized protein LOC105276450 isoform X2 n=1 Tax=Ooceraea biroi TaxID=2015173 RepID=UPI000F075CF6|nr:uncharacterized protein LOC105276450 isoform X2 [Ooceraea biroi]
MCRGIVARTPRVRKSRHGFLLLLLSIAHLPLLRHADAKILRGDLVTPENWAFVARFCFLTERGTFRYHFTLGGQERNLNLLLYYDGEHQWPNVYPSNKTCEEKESVLDIEHGQVVPLNTSMSLSSGCTRGTDDVVQCDSQRRFISVRPRWWFVALADCSSTNGLNVSYWISLTNAPTGTFWKEHFSADEFCKHTAAADRDRQRLRDPRRVQPALRAATALQAAAAHILQDVHGVPAVSTARRALRDLQLREPRPEGDAGGECLSARPARGGELRDAVHDADAAARARLHGHQERPHAAADPLARDIRRRDRLLSDIPLHLRVRGVRFRIGAVPVRVAARLLADRAQAHRLVRLRHALLQDHQEDEHEAQLLRLAALHGIGVVPLQPVNGIDHHHIRGQMDEGERR